MQVIKTDDFLKQLGRLPLQIRRYFPRQEKIFLENIHDPRLHLKKLAVRDEIFSFRLTRNYRCLFYFHQNNVAVFFAADHRKDIYR